MKLFVNIASSRNGINRITKAPIPFAYRPLTLFLTYMAANIIISGFSIQGLALLNVLVALVDARTSNSDQDDG